MDDEMKHKYYDLKDKMIKKKEEIEKAKQELRELRTQQKNMFNLDVDSRRFQGIVEEEVK